ncbi:MAG: POTRA domain-containing protein, partial [Pseudomonadota bacterium]
MRHNYQDCLHSLLKFFVLGITLVLLSARLQAAEVNYSVEISVLDDVQISGAQANDESRLLKDLLQQHLDIVKWRDNPRMSPAEWLRLYQATPQAIADLLATEGYFSPEITPSIDTAAGVSQARFLVNPGKPVLVNSVNINFTGDILQQDPTEQSARLASMATLKQNWLLPPGTVFKQSEWNQAKRRLLINLLVERYPNASIKASKAEVDPALSTVAITLEVDSGESFTFGELTIEGLQRYPASIIQDLNRIKPGTTYSQTRLQVLQSRLEESGYFQGVEVTASTATAVNDVVPVKVVVQENPSIKMGLGAGYSTNTGARAQLTYDDLNLFNRGWRLTSSLKPEQRAQSLSALVRLP